MNCILYFVSNPRTADAVLMIIEYYFVHSVGSLRNRGRFPSFSSDNYIMSLARCGCSCVPTTHLNHYTYALVLLGNRGVL